MKNVLHKIAGFLRTVFGYGITVCLFAGGLTFFAYVVALIVGGDTAALICDITYNKVIPVIVYATTILVLLGLLIMYLSGEKALTASKKESSKHEGEM